MHAVHRFCCIAFCLTVLVTAPIPLYQKSQHQNLDTIAAASNLLLCKSLQCTSFASASTIQCFGWTLRMGCCLILAGEHIENTLEALRALIQKDNATPGGLITLAYIEFDVHVRFLKSLLHEEQAFQACMLDQTMHSKLGGSVHQACKLRHADCGAGISSPLHYMCQKYSKVCKKLAPGRHRPYINACTSMYTQ